MCRNFLHWIDKTRVSLRYVDQVQWCRVRARYQFLLARLAVSWSSGSQISAEKLLLSNHVLLDHSNFVPLLFECLWAWCQSSITYRPQGSTFFFVLIFTCFRVKMWVKCILFRVLGCFYFSNFDFSVGVMIQFLFESLRRVFFSIYGLQINIICYDC